MHRDKIIKYLLFAIVIGFILKTVPDLYKPEDGDKKIVMHIILATGAFVLLDMFIFNKNEGMESVKGETTTNAVICSGPDCPDYPDLNDLISADTSESCDLPYKEPCPYKYSYQDEDYLNTGIKYDHNTPGYYLLNNGVYAAGIPYDKIGEMICKSKLHTLQHQHNYNVKWSPHTHIGKARGYLNPDKTEENVQ